MPLQSLLAHRLPAPRLQLAPHLHKHAHCIWRGNGVTRVMCLSPLLVMMVMKVVVSVMHFSSTDSFRHQIAPIP